MGYIYNKKLNTFEFTSKVKISLLDSYNISNNKTSLMLTLDENKFIRQTDDARNLKVQFTGNGTGTTANDLKPNTPYTLASLVTNIAYLFNQRYTKTEVDNLVSASGTSLDWKASVNTYNDIATAYPNPQDGWTVNVKDTDITYRYDGSKWIAISANSIPLATQTLDGRMSKADKIKLDGIQAGATKYTHPSSHPATMITEDSTHRFVTNAQITKWDGMSPKNHTHTIAQITDISSASVRYASSAGTANAVDWVNVLSKPSLPTNLINGTATGSLKQSTAHSASGNGSLALGTGTKAQGYNQVVMGKYNTPSGTSTSNKLSDLAFIVGGGTSDSARANAFSVSFAGVTSINGCYGTSGADYAEYFEWKDGNESYEDRVGLFVTLDKDKIRICNEKDDYILGVVSATPSVLGDSNDTEWSGKYEKDEFGRKIIEFGKDKFGRGYEKFLISKDYNPDLEYIPRSKRPEWSPIGMIGKVFVYDDGTCFSGGFCTCGKDGKATSIPYAYNSNKSFKVLKRINKNIIQIILK